MYVCSGTLIGTEKMHIKDFSPQRLGVWWRSEQELGAGIHSRTKSRGTQKTTPLFSARAFGAHDKRKDGIYIEIYDTDGASETNLQTVLEFIT